MEISRKKINKKETIPSIQTRKLTQKLSYITLDLLCSYLLSDNRNIRAKGYSNIAELISIIDPNDYKEDSDIERLDFIKFGLDARIKYGLINGAQVKDYILSNDVSHAGKYNINIQELSNKDVTYIDDTVTNLLDSSEFSASIHSFDKLSREFDSANSYKKKEIIETWKSLVKKCNAQIRANKVEKSEEEYVSLSNGVFENYARDTYSYISNESSKLCTGMQGLNYLLGGGVESGRVYGFFGLQGEGKSTTLFNLATQIKMYNRNYKTKDPTKRPAVVYLTLENTKRETFTRLFSISTDAGRLIDYDIDEGIQMMRNNGMSISDDNPIDIIIKYKPSNSISTNYLYDFAEELAEDGYEVICFIVDYINVIRSIYNFSASEERLRLGSIINEFKVIAATMDIPIITAGQLNRDANKKVDEARNSGDLNLLNKVDRSNLGESMQILNNLDGAFLITPSYIQNTKEKYLAIKLVKNRFNPFLEKLDYNYGIYHPYESIDSIRLKCDIYAKKPEFLYDLSIKKTDTCNVDKSVKIPNNNKRYNPNEDYDVQPIISPIALYDDGTKPLYEVNWRNLPAKLNGSTNVDALCPEDQFRSILSKEEFKNIMSSSINSLNGISRYSDTYTKLYDPGGSKEERLVHDYNIKYGNDRFTKEDFPMLYSHFMMMKNGEIPDTDEFREPSKHYEQEAESIFINVPEIDREALLKYLSGNG